MRIEKGSLCWAGVTADSSVHLLEQPVSPGSAPLSDELIPDLGQCHSVLISDTRGGSCPALLCWEQKNNWSWEFRGYRLFNAVQWKDWSVAQNNLKSRSAEMRQEFCSQRYRKLESSVASKMAFISTWRGDSISKCFLGLFFCPICTKICEDEISRWLVGHMILNYFRTWKNLNKTVFDVHSVVSAFHVIRAIL